MSRYMSPIVRLLGKHSSGPLALGSATALWVPDLLPKKLTKELKAKGILDEDYKEE